MLFILSALLEEFGDASGLLASLTPLVVELLLLKLWPALASWFRPRMWRLPELWPAELRPLELRPVEKLRPVVELRSFEERSPAGLSLPSRTVLGLDSLFQKFDDCLFNLFNFFLTNTVYYM